MITSHVLGESELILVFLNTKIGLLVNVLNAHMNPMIIVSFLYWLGIQYFQNTGNTFLELPPLTSLFNGLQLAEKADSVFLHLADWLLLQRRADRSWSEAAVWIFLQFLQHFYEHWFFHLLLHRNLEFSQYLLFQNFAGFATWYCSFVREQSQRVLAKHPISNVLAEQRFTAAFLIRW